MCSEALGHLLIGRCKEEALDTKGLLDKMMLNKILDTIDIGPFRVHILIFIILASSGIPYGILYARWILSGSPKPKENTTWYY